MRRLLLLACVACTAQPAPHADTTPPAPHAPATRAERLIAEAESLAVHDIADPESARWRNVHIAEHDSLGVCGELNSRTPAGGYGGYTPVAVIPSTGEVIRADDPPREITRERTYAFFRICITPYPDDSLVTDRPLTVPPLR